MSKIYEFLDTVFMVLRKRNRQINLLHVYHHASIAYVWLAVNTRYFPGGDSWWAASLNSLVHVVMYAYYLMATLKIPCFFKKYITMFQILQFVSFVAQGAYGLIWPSYYPNSAMAFNLCYAASLLALFIRFYRASYKKKSA